MVWNRVFGVSLLLLAFAIIFTPVALQIGVLMTLAVLAGSTALSAIIVFAICLLTR